MTNEQSTQTGKGRGGCLASAKGCGCIIVIVGGVSIGLMMVSATFHGSKIRDHTAQVDKTLRLAADAESRGELSTAIALLESVEDLEHAKQQDEVADRLYDYRLALAAQKEPEASARLQEATAALAAGDLNLALDRANAAAAFKRTPSASLAERLAGDIRRLQSGDLLDDALKAIPGAALRAYVDHGVTPPIPSDIEPEAMRVQFAKQWPPSMDAAKAEHERREKAEAQAAQAADLEDARQAVLRLIQGNRFGVGSAVIRSRTNPKGAGIFVYCTKTRFSGTERLLVWLVLDGQVLPLNGPSKMLTPDQPWPREISEEKWGTTNLSPYSATYAVELLW